MCREIQKAHFVS